MTDKLTLELSIPEYLMVMEALDMMLIQNITPRSGANHFALYDHMADEIGKYERQKIGRKVK